MSLLTNSRLVAALDSLVSCVETSFANSNLRRAAWGAWQMVGARERAQAVAFSGIVVTVAMAVHISLVVVVQPYAFPSRAELALPACLLGVGIASVLLRNGIAAAWQNRRWR